MLQSLKEWLAASIECLQVGARYRVALQLHPHEDFAANPPHGPLGPTAARWRALQARGWRVRALLCVCVGGGGGEGLLEECRAGRELGDSSPSSDGSFTPGISLADCQSTGNQHLQTHQQCCYANSGHRLLCMTTLSAEVG